MDVFQGVVDLVVAPLSPEQEKELNDAIDEADRGELVDGAAAFVEMHRRLHGAG